MACLAGNSIIILQSLLSVPEVVTHFFIASYYIKWLTTSWTSRLPCMPGCIGLLGAPSGSWLGAAANIYNQSQSGIQFQMCQMQGYILFKY